MTAVTDTLRIAVAQFSPVFRPDVFEFSVNRRANPMIRESDGRD